MTTETRIVAQIIQDADGYRILYPQRTADGSAGIPGLTYQSPAFPVLADALFQAALGAAPCGQDFLPWWESVKREVEGLIAQTRAA